MIRIVGGVGVLLALLFYDLWRSGWRSRRLVEYAFVVSMLVLTGAYCLAFDMVTATISPEYFWWGKEVGRRGLPFPAGVAVTALGAAWPIGLLLGAALLAANSLRADSPLPVRRLYAYLSAPILASLIVACLCGVLFGFDPVDEERELPNWSRAVKTRFLVVQGIHLGAYAGGIVGSVIAVRRILRASGTALGVPTRGTTP